MILSIIMESLIGGDGKITADKLMEQFYKKYPNAIKRPKTWFNAFLSDLKKHFKTFIADIIMQLIEEGVSTTSISLYLSTALNYNITQANVSQISKKLLSGTPLHKKPPKTELQDTVNFEKRRTMEDVDAKRNILNQRLNNLYNNMINEYQSPTTNQPKDFVEIWIKRYQYYINEAITNVGLLPEQADDLVLEIIDKIRAKLQAIESAHSQSQDV